MAPTNPYTRLKEIGQRFANKVHSPKRRTMWVYPKARIEEGWNLRDLRERVMAASQLGFEVLLEADDGDLHVIYQEKRPETPWELE